MFFFYIYKTERCEERGELIYLARESVQESPDMLYYTIILYAMLCYAIL